MRKSFLPIMVMALSAGPLFAAEAEAPWWKQQKIHFGWSLFPCDVGERIGELGYHDMCRREMPEELFRNAALSGVTVFTQWLFWSPRHARLAKKYGMKYFVPSEARVPLWCRLPGVRRWVKENGEGEMIGDSAIKCSLDEKAHEWWLIHPFLDGIREGIIDGIHIDWEAGGYTQSPCYCDDCFARFLEHQAIEDDMPAKAERFEWLKSRKLVRAYADRHSQRRVAMFTRIREKLQAVKPDLLFSSYGTLITDFTTAMNTPETPFIFLDARHYYNEDRQPWWESYSKLLREEGYLYITGGWSNALFGSQASQVSAARWIYEAAINEDGVWLWCEHGLTDDMLRAYATAHRSIKTAELAVGDFLFNGRRDYNFVTAVEWTGRPELEQAVIVRTCHLNDEHLLHVNYVDTDWPVQVRLRLPHLAEGRNWTVFDTLTKLYYAQAGGSATWTSADLHRGVVLTMEPRTDAFLLVAPAVEDFQAAPSELIPSREFYALPDHALAAEQAFFPVKALDLYVLNNSIYDEQLTELLKSTEKITDLPKAGWHFRWDKEDVGAGMGWFRPQGSLDDWTPIETEAFWGDKGGQRGPGWYRADVDIPALPAGKRILLHFGAVDEELVLWIDGEYAGDYNRGPAGWDKPFAIDLTEKLTAGRHHLAMRVYNYAFAGGVWKPVSILAAPAAADVLKPTTSPDAGTASSRFVYTATEQISVEGHSGVRTIVANSIRAADGTGGSQIRLRKLRGQLWTPVYSPDGTRIAFVHNAAGRGQIHVMSSDGSDAVNISQNAFSDRSPAWSPDGTRLAFASERSGDWDIWTMNADGSGQRRLAGNPGLDRAPAWSSDGRRIAWESHVSGIPGIWVCDADGRGSRALLAADRPLSVQRGHTESDGVFNFVEVDTVFKGNTFYLMDPVWSPDSQRIAATCLGVHSGNMAVVLDADGSRMLQLTGGVGGIGELAWSPDGKQLAGMLRTAPQETERSGIFVMKADGTDTYRWLVDVTPQGPRLGGASRLGPHTWYSHGSAQPRRVVKSFSSLAWAPDGKTLAFSSDMDQSGAFCVYTIDPGGGNPQRLDRTRSAWPQKIMWRPR